MAQPTVDLKNRHLAAFLAWLVPGLGHLYQGRRGKAALYATTILGLFFVGLVLGDWKIAYWRWTTPMRDPENFRASYLCQFWVGLAALPDYMGRDLDGLLQVLPELKAPRLDAYFVYPEEMRHSKRVSVFRDFLVAELAGH